MKKILILTLLFCVVACSEEGTEPEDNQSLNQDSYSDNPDSNGPIDSDTTDDQAGDTFLENDTNINDTALSAPTAPEDSSTITEDTDTTSEDTDIITEDTETITDNDDTENECLTNSEVTYILHRAQNPNADQLEAYALITEAMDTAIEYYSCYTNITTHINVYFDPGVPTAQANISGPVIQFGSRGSMNHITAMHEISHTVGVAYYSWQSMFQDGFWIGERANNLLKEIENDPEARIRGDRMHFWPYGLNYTHEVTSEDDLINHCRLVVALRADMGV